MSDKTGHYVPTGRLALREEGDYWNAYYAEPDTMVGAVHLGSVLIGIVRKSPRIKKLFIRMMKETISMYLKDVTGYPNTWDKPKSAPEHERTKE